MMFYMQYSICWHCAASVPLRIVFRLYSWKSLLHVVLRPIFETRVVKLCLYCISLSNISSISTYHIKSGIEWSCNKWRKSNMVLSTNMSFWNKFMYWCWIFLKNQNAISIHNFQFSLTEKHEGCSFEQEQVLVRLITICHNY